MNSADFRFLWYQIYYGKNCINWIVVFDWYIGTSVNILILWCSIKLHSFMHVLVHVLWNYNSRPIKGLSASVDFETHIYNHFEYKDM